LKETKYILGIETSCDDTSVAIIKHTDPSVVPEILSHLKFGQEEILKIWGGVVPEIAARNHLLKITPLLKQCFLESGVKESQIDAIAVTSFPGLLGPLLTGVNAAKTLALIYKKPVIPTNHLYAHIEAIHLTHTTIKYPFMSLLVSGGHSLYLWVSARDSFEILGGTIDDASGEAFDKGGKLLGLGYPAGHIIDRLAKFGDKEKYEFPIGLKASGDSRLSFSGLKTSLRVFLDKNPHILEQAPTQFFDREEQSQVFYDVCASYQNAIAKALILKMKYAFKKAPISPEQIRKTRIVVGGGVACNSELRLQFNAKYPQTVFVDPEFCTDNAAMIANFGLRNLESAIPFPECLSIDARGRFIQKKEMNEKISR
jgi:N6-L-threonylcarbamoyladenine synthase